MTSDLLPRHLSLNENPTTEPQLIVEAFLAALADDDAELADSLIDDDIDYVNVSLPAVRGRKEMAKVFDLLKKEKAGFEVYLHAISADGGTVLTERTDVLIFGPLRMQFWVWGRFDVANGKITLWRDSFDFVDLFRGFVRGVAAIAVPSLQTKAPSSQSEPPGR